MKFVVWLAVFLTTIAHVISGYRTLPFDSLKEIAKLSLPGTLDIQGGRLLSPFLVERVSGTPSNAKVRDMIIQHFQRLDWHIELDTFTTSTIVGEKTFTNIIVTKQPEAGRRLVLAAHYDSMNTDYGFIGATDSAVPCALLLSLAETLNDQLATSSEWSGGRRQSADPAEMTSLELVFFDGEEAFVQWSDSDSIYGAKHLAEKWEKAPGIGQQRSNRLQMIDALVLLDLMGTPNATFHNYFRSTSDLFGHLGSLEQRLASAAKSSSANDGLWKSVDRFGHPLATMFPSGPTQLMYQSFAMSDDHLPFRDRGVNILHLIPYPFPKEWHTSLDNADCLDPPTIGNYDILFRAFVCEYLDLVPVPHGEL